LAPTTSTKVDYHDPRGSSRRLGWLVLFLVISIVLTTLWYREGSTGPVHRVRSAVATVTTPVTRAGHWVFTPVRSFVAWVSDLGVSRSQLAALRQQNDELRAAAIQADELRAENERLSALLGVGESVASSGVAAGIIGLPDDNYDRVIVLDKGTGDGITLGLPVTTARGLLGQIVELGPNWSKARLISDQKSGVAALVQSKRIPGVVKGSLDGTLNLDFVPVDTKVEVGDVVLTSGLGGVYPKGLVIGEVTDVSDELNTLYKTIVITPANTDPGNIEDVLILTSAPPPISETTGGEEL
jgi:rod shape-determining protein MreC